MIFLLFFNLKFKVTAVNIIYEDCAQQDCYYALHRAQRCSSGKVGSCWEVPSLQEGNCSVNSFHCN